MDWEVFHVLPDEIKLELKVELRRRGMLSEKSTPTKGKTYLQQLLPTQAGNAPKYIRVTKSPQEGSLLERVDWKHCCQLKLQNRNLYMKSLSHMIPQY